MIITIDGPIATGKSTIAKRLAEQIGFIYFDTGAMYRCMTYGILKHGISLEDQGALKNFLDALDIDVKIHYQERRYFVEKEDVTDKIRGMQVTEMVSKVAAIGLVREKLASLQRELAEGVNAVFEGRDMGTTVFPHAGLKIFLTGSPEVRAKRRFDELCSKYPEEAKNLSFEKVLESINRRDHLDSTREISPLRQAEDAFVIDTSTKTVDEIIYEILECKDAAKKNHKRSS